MSSPHRTFFFLTWAIRIKMLNQSLKDGGRVFLLLLLTLIIVVSAVFLLLINTYKTLHTYLLKPDLLKISEFFHNAEKHMWNFLPFLSFTFFFAFLAYYVSAFLDLRKQKYMHHEKDISEKNIPMGMMTRNEFT